MLTPARIRLGLLAFLFCAFDGFAQDQTAPATVLDLQHRLAGIVEQPKYAAAFWGAKVVSLDSGKELFECNSHKLFSPASNSKLYTVALALARLGADYRIRTSLFSQSQPARGILKGDLILYGRGDPGFNARLNQGDIFKALERLVSALTNAGVKRITGDLIMDTSYFRGPEYGSGWVWDDLESYYGAEVTALTINDNVLSLSILPGETSGAPGKLLLSPATAFLSLSNRTQTVEKGSRRSLEIYRPLGGNLAYVSGQVPLGDSGYSEEVPVHNPAGLFGELFAQALARHGVKVDGRIKAVSWLERPGGALDCGKLVELGAVESLPLRDLAREIFKPSQNLYTDLVLAHIGERARTSENRPEETSGDLGIRELNKFLAEVGIKRGEVLFEEGSGLSRDNLTTPAATVGLLQFMSRQSCAKDYLDALPIAGVDGTLRNRMKGTTAAGNVRAKTGTLRWASSLSGYVTSAAGEHLVFSMMVNRFHNSGTDGPARADLDAMAVLLAGFTGSSNQ